MKRSGNSSLENLILIDHPGFGIGRNLVFLLRSITSGTSKLTAQPTKYAWWGGGLVTCDGSTSHLEDVVILLDTSWYRNASAFNEIQRLSESNKRGPQQLPLEA